MFIAQNNYSEVPWMTDDIKNSDGVIKLSKEIIEFTKLVEPTKEENLLREKTLSILKGIFKAEFPGWKVKAFGSYPVNLHLPDSDIDIVIIPDSHSTYSEDQVFNKIDLILKRKKLVKYCQIIKAKVPILKAIINETSINVDITVNRTNGYKTKDDVMRVLHRVPSMRKLIYVLKYFLRQRQLNDAYSGGVSSFLLFNLVYAFFCYYIKSQLLLSTELEIESLSLGHLLLEFFEFYGGGVSSFLLFNLVYAFFCYYIESQLLLSTELEIESLSLGHLLLEFFEFYGVQFNYKKVGSSIRNGVFFYQRNDAEENRKHILSVENYQEPTQDIGKGAYKFNVVIDSFTKARDSLRFPDSVGDSFLDKVINVDNFLLERKSKKKEREIEEKIKLISKSEKELTSMKDK
eukprot:CAMPEP_0170535868 /NCGR_PEP_ID=MMETSP0209-20121228/101835_1 /TAXON_ID=665100 ORGANISM="Litonotus pictus, Strain P1" /NCGR_SAMPLE_ID=MMETSP0209 /ASSEMBLY_ACC=CAM_ASM_000301 /LENGTH=403 /DNA_ID=CAMNT_0010837175 /DNA_START=1613 /DNA_END=2824 /DNA_ORIENTATION=-